MGNYYDILVENINQALRANDYVLVKQLIDDELNMPYVPLEVEKRLKALKESLPLKDEPLKTINVDYDMIALLLKGSVQQQVQAIEYLDDLNIRVYLPLIKDYLIKDNLAIIKCYLIAICIRQQINDELAIEKDGLNYQIIPSALQLPEQSDGYVLCQKKLEDMMINDDPSLLNMTLDVLHQLAYLKLPDEYDIDEIEILTYSILRYVLKAMNDEDRWLKLKEECQINENMMIDINL